MGRVFSIFGFPLTIVSDNGPEFITSAEAERIHELDLLKPSFPFLEVGSEPERFAIRFSSLGARGTLRKVIEVGLEFELNVLSLLRDCRPLFP